MADDFGLLLEGIFRFINLGSLSRVGVRFRTDLIIILMHNALLQKCFIKVLAKVSFCCTLSVQSVETFSGCKVFRIFRIFRIFSIFRIFRIFGTFKIFSISEMLYQIKFSILWRLLCG